jgi:hypothetical protein
LVYLSGPLIATLIRYTTGAIISITIIHTTIANIITTIIRTDTGTGVTTVIGTKTMIIKLKRFALLGGPRGSTKRRRARTFGGAVEVADAGCE